MQAVLESWQEERRRQFRRLVAISAVTHVAAGLLFWVSPFQPRSRVLPGVVRIDLLAVAPPSAAPLPAAKKLPKPAPIKAAPKPKPKPKPKPVVEKKVLPKEPVARPTPAPPAPAKELSYEEALAQLRKSDTSAIAPAPSQPSAALRPGPVGGPGRLISAAEAAWRERARAYVLQAWVLAPGFRSQTLVTVVDVQISRAGEVSNPRIAQRSGNPWFDESVERAVQKAGPLPPPPEAGRWQFRFSPMDLR